MNIQESLDIIENIKKAQKNTKTPIGAAYSLQQYLKKKVLQPLAHY